MSENTKFMAVFVAYSIVVGILVEIVDAIFRFFDHVLRATGMWSTLAGLLALGLSLACGFFVVACGLAYYHRDKPAVVD